jgi:hypothetical protein
LSDRVVPHGGGADAGIYVAIDIAKRIHEYRGWWKFSSVISAHTGRKLLSVT